MSSSLKAWAISKIKGVNLITFTQKSKQIGRYINIECNVTPYLCVMLEELQFSEPEY